jgi:hypothetical protein
LVVAAAVLLDLEELAEADLEMELLTLVVVL